MKKIILPIIATIMALGATAASPVKTLTDSEMLSDVYNYTNGTTVTKRPALIDLWAPWCGPCRRLAPTIDSLATEYAGRVDFYKVKVDNNPAISSAFRVQSIPMVLLIPTDGGSPRYLLGVQPADNLRKAIDDVLLKK